MYTVKKMDTAHYLKTRVATAQKLQYKLPNHRTKNIMPVK